MCDHLVFPLLSTRSLLPTIDAARPCKPASSTAARHSFVSYEFVLVGRRQATDGTEQTIGFVRTHGVTRVRKAGFPSRVKSSTLLDRDIPVVAHCHPVWVVSAHLVHSRIA